MSRTYTVQLDTAAGFRSSSNASASTTLNWTTSTSYKQMGRAGGTNKYRYATTMRSVSQTMQALAELPSSSITSIILHVSTSSTQPTYDLDMYVGALVATSGKSTITNSKAVTWPAANTSATFDITSCGIPSTYGYALGDNTKNATYLTFSSAYIEVTTNETELTLSYDANGGSGAPSSQTASGSGSVSFTISSTTPTRTGHAFQGWALTSSATTAAYQAGGTISISSDVTLYAVWKANTYTVSYNANGGTGAPASQTKTYGTDLVLSTTAPTRTGYEYTIWNTAADGSGTSYVPGDTYSANANLTLYAQWVVTTYNIHYEGNGGSGVPADQVKTYNVATTISSVTPTRAGYTFGGWNTSADGSGTNYASGATYSTNANLTLYAKWSVAGVTVSFNANGGTCSEASRTVYPGSAYGTLPVPSWENHTFDGWFTSASGGDQVNASTIVTNGSAHTLFAHWTAAPSPGRHYAVAYYKHNGQMKTVRVYIKNNGEMKVGSLYSL